ncbi:MAG: Gfo/Idh/MocA family oxidoreductase [Ignavibacteriae bacterium]|nr:Gfo/Idh/MocA family oxidoreductase [Ignavibacteriota bacterium]
MTGQRVSVGILGTASVARFLCGQKFEHLQLAAVASRSIEKAHRFADEGSIPKRYGAYDDLLADPEIDAVYIPLPQHLHCEYTLKAARAGKHVLVEKPAAVSSRELELMKAACEASNVLFMEGFMYRFKRVHNRAKEIVDEGTIGKLRYMTFAWSHNIANRGHDGFRLEKNLGGGCLRDLGVYGVDWIRFITDSEPRLLNAVLHRRNDGLDVFAHATYDAGGVVATMIAGYSTDANYYLLSGEKGSIYSPVSLSGRVLPNVLTIHLLGHDKHYVEKFPAENAYVRELEYFAQCIKEQFRPFLDAENSLKNLQLIEQIESSADPI